MIGEWLRSDAKAGQGRTCERVAGDALCSPTHNVGKNSGERNAPNAAYVTPHTVCADLFVDSANVPGKSGFNGASYALQVFESEKGA
jgi:ribosomal protein L32